MSGVTPRYTVDAPITYTVKSDQAVVGGQLLEVVAGGVVQAASAGSATVVGVAPKNARGTYNPYGTTGEGDFLMDASGPGKGPQRDPHSGVTQPPGIESGQNPLDRATWVATGEAPQNWDIRIVALCLSRAAASGRQDVLFISNDALDAVGSRKTPSRSKHQDSLASAEKVALIA